MLKTIVFDYDGPLVDLFDEDDGKEATCQVISVGKSFGLNTNSPLFGSRFLDAWANLRSQLAGDQALLRKLDFQIHSVLEKIERNSIEAIKSPDPYSYRMLEIARQSFQKVAIVSNNSQEAIKEWVAKHSLLVFVDLVVGRAKGITFDQLKPNPFLLLEAIRQLRCDPTTVLFVGDTESDLRCSQDAKTSFLGLQTRHSPPPQELKNSQGILWFKSRLDLLGYLEAAGFNH